MFPAQRTWRLRSVACLLAFAAGCANTRDSERPYGLGGASDRDSGLRLDRANQQVAQLENNLRKAREEASNLDKQLAGHKEIRSILEQRLDNLRQENDRLSEEIAGIVLQAGGTKSPSARSVMTTVSGSAPAPEIPASVTNSLKDLANKSGQFTYDPEKKMCRLPSSFLFEGGGDQVRSEAQGVLRQVVTILNADKAASLNVLVVGHTSPLTPIPKEMVAQHPTDWHLASHQAIAVQQFLEENGLSAARAGVISYGSHQPLVDGADDVARRKNERVEIYLTPPDPAGE